MKEEESKLKVLEEKLLDFTETENAIFKKRGFGFIEAERTYNNEPFPVWSHRIQLKNLTHLKKNIHKISKKGDILYEALISYYRPDFHTWEDTDTYTSDVNEPLNMFINNIELATDTYHNLRKLELVKNLIGDKVTMYIEDRSDMGTGYFDVETYFWDYNKALIKQLLKLKKDSEEYKAVEFALYKAKFYSPSDVNRLVYKAAFNWKKLAEKPVAQKNKK